MKLGRRQPAPRKTLGELLVGEPAWPTIEGWMASSRRGPSVLPGAREAREATLVGLQVTTHSTLGAMAHETSGVVLDHGWLRLLGGGGSVLPDLVAASPTGPGQEPPPYVVFAHDVLGGRFAVNGGGLPAVVGEVSYFSPTNLRWEPTGMRHGQLLEWALVGDMPGFYGAVRWPGWQDDVAAVALDEGLTAERQVLPWAEVVAAQTDVIRQIGS